MENIYSNISGSPFRYINPNDEVYHLVIVWTVLGCMKYLTRRVKRAAEAVGIWTKENWDLRKVSSLYTMESGRINFTITKRFDSLSWSSVVRYLHTRRGYTFG